MKKVNFATSLVAFLVAIFAIGSINTASAQYDDLYFNPEDEVETAVAAVEVEETESAKNYDYTEDYVSDYQYSSRIRRFRRPIRNASYFTDYYVNTFYYDPFAPRTTIYAVSPWSAYNLALFRRPSRFYGNTAVVINNPYGVIGNGFTTTNVFYTPNNFGGGGYFNNNFYNGFGGGGIGSSVIARGCPPVSANFNNVNPTLNNYYGNTSTGTPGLNSYYTGNNTNTRRPTTTTNTPRRGTNTRPTGTTTTPDRRTNGGTVRSTSRRPSETKSTRVNRTRRVDTNTGNTRTRTKTTRSTRTNRAEPSRRTNTRRSQSTRPTRPSRSTTTPSRSRSNYNRSTPTRTNRSSGTRTNRSSSTRSTRSTRSSSSRSSSRRGGRN